MPSSPQCQSTVNKITVLSDKESKVIGVSVYNGRAEITREVNVSVKVGQNNVTIVGLSTYLDVNSMRVEGRGAGTIQGITVSRTPTLETVDTSDIIETSKEKEEEIQAAIERCKHNRDAVLKYLETLNAEHVDAEKLTRIIVASEENQALLDKKLANLKKELVKVKKEIEEEKERLNPKKNSNSLSDMQVQIGVFVEEESDIGLVLKYAVGKANWDAVYDVRVNTQVKENSVRLVYQARITQNTGEDWVDVPIQLETNTPTYRQSLPTLETWSLDVKKKPVPQMKRPKRIMSNMAYSLPRGSTAAAVMSRNSSDDDEMVLALSDCAVAPAPKMMCVNAAYVKNNGAVSATYGIPGFVTISSDGDGHNLTIIELDLDATLSWATVPKIDTQVFLQARIKNTSDYILLAGEANIYVDGSFISKSRLSLTNPQEKFDVSLGVDRGVKVTYQDRRQRSSHTGILNKSSNKSSTQRITIQNTKLTSLNTLTILDSIPVSKDSRIVVKLKSPELALPNLNVLQRTLSISQANDKNSSSKDGLGSSKTTERDEETIKKKNPIVKPTIVSTKPQVTAQWNGADDSDSDYYGLGSSDSNPVQLDAIGQDGKIKWVVNNLESMESVNLSFSWEVLVPEGLEVESSLGLFNA